MATYDSSGIKSGNTLNEEQLITELNKLPAAVGAGSAALLSSASSTYVTAASATLTVSTDDLIIVAGQMNFSSSDGASSIGAMRLYQASTLLTNDYFLKDTASSTAGNQSCASICYYAENLSGSIAFSVKFARFSGSGTIYSVNSQVAVYVVKKK